jgi:spermidine synthase
MKSRLLPALLLLFVGSGCAALIYEVVWFQLLELVIGVSAVSMGVLLGTFMGGMCVGSFVVPRWLAPRTHPLRVYAFLELGIGLFGLLLLFGMPLVGGAYTAWAGSGVRGIFMRALFAAICLLPPTLLMGATLPAIARWIETTPKGVAWLGFFYGGNTAGAVIGSMIAGFYLLRVYDVSVATYVAVALNVVVALLAMAIASFTVYEPAPGVVAAADGRPIASGAQGSRMVYVVIALSGFTALGCEVLWTRLLSLVFGATTYTFSLILAVFLLGLGIGSSVGSAMARTIERPRVALAWFQILLSVAMAWTAYVLTQWYPYWPINPSIASDLSYQFQLDFFRCLFAVLPGSLLWGASFPLALASVVSEDEDPARLVGGVYAANTLGAIFGALSVAMVFVSTIGSQHSEMVLIGVAGVSGLLLLWQERASTAAFGVATLTAALMALTVHPLPGILVAYGRYSATQLGQSEVIYVGEGWNASVAVSRRENGVLNYHNAGKVQASSEPQDMRLQRMLGHLTTLVPKKADTVVVIGCGAGVTAGAVSIDPTLKQETIAEIEPLVPRFVGEYFSEHNFGVVKNPKVRIHIDDARHFLFTTNEKFDAITSDPLDPWVKGAAMLYTREFFELAKTRLNPGGIMTLFVQLYESNLEAVKSEIATFFEAFPKGMIFANLYNGQGYDLVLLGQAEGTTIDVDAMQAKLDRPEFAPVKHSLAQIGMNSAVDLFGTYAGEAADFAPWMKDAQINRDRNLRLQYLAGRGLNLYQADVIYNDMAVYSKDPKPGLFTGSPATLQALLDRIHMEQGRQ